MRFMDFFIGESAQPRGDVVVTQITTNLDVCLRRSNRRYIYAAQVGRVFAPLNSTHPMAEGNPEVGFTRLPKWAFGWTEWLGRPTRG